MQPPQGQMSDQMWDQARPRRQTGPAVLLSLLLHGLLVLLALWYLGHRPPLTQTPLRALPVDLVIGGGAGQAWSATPATRLQVARPHPESAPVPEGTNPHGTKEPEDESSARLRALALAWKPSSS